MSTGNMCTGDCVQVSVSNEGLQDVDRKLSTGNCVQESVSNEGLQDVGR